MYGLRRFSRFAHKTLGRSHNSSLTRGTQFGFEYSPFADEDVQNNLLERSMKNGCRTVLSRTKPYVERSYEKIYDFAEDNEDFDIHTMQLGHISTNPITTSTSDIMREIEDIQSVLKYSKRDLDLITLAMPNNTAEWSYNQIQETLEQVQATTSGSSIGNSSLQVGLDLNTKILSQCTQKDVEYLIQTILQPLADRNILSTLTVACNAYTYQNTNTIFNWIHLYNTTNSTTNTTNSSPKITSFATELLRTHNHRPGLLSSGYSHTMPHRMAVSEQKDDNTSNTPATTTNTTTEGVVYSKTMHSMVGKVQVAVEDFKMALDRCMHAEKIFLSKISSTGQGSIGAVAVTEVCLAHVLSNTYSQFRSPEEWQYVLNSQVDPRLQRGLKLLSGDGATGEQRDWVTIYAPMSKYLLSSFRHLLQERSLLLSQEIIGSLDKHTISTTTINTSSSESSYTVVPQRLAQFTAQWTKASCTMVGNNQVNATQWDANLNNNNINISEQEVYRHIHEVLSSHN